EDLNDDGVPDESTIESPVLAGPPHNILKNRYISIDPTAGGENPSSLSVRVTMTDSLIEDVTGLNRDYFASATSPEELCISVVTTNDPGTVSWTGCPVVHLTGCPIVPTSTYAIVVIDGEGSVSDPLVANTQAKPGVLWHGDAVGTFDGNDWSGPNGVVNFDDVTATIKTFIDPNAFNAVHVSLVDVHPQFFGGPHNNRLININDVLVMILGFQGAEYAEPDLTQCP
ncbi:MAG: hypothetical protein IIC02_08915, partial [Planctomycetes bacterium]|nr:hypothetical protein [Planctomycetota bacterium]